MRDQSQAKGGGKEGDTVLYAASMIPKTGGGDPRINPTAQHTTPQQMTVNPATQTKPRSNRGEETQKSLLF